MDFGLASLTSRLSTLRRELGTSVSRAIIRPVRRQMVDRLNLTDPCLSAREREIVLALARTAMPGGIRLTAPNEDTVDRFALQFERFPASQRGALRTALWGIELASTARYGRPFTRLSEAVQDAVLRAWYEGSVPRRLALRAVLSPIKLAHFADSSIFDALGCSYGVKPAAHLERARWRQNAIELSALEADEAIECDVVVVGTGAGGAVVAKELAERGLAVAMVEEGEYYDRRHFDGRALEALGRMYHGGGTVFSVGNPPILIPTGRTVGGSTTINSGTCLRVPDRVLERWRTEFGLRQFTPDALAPYFERVESILRVAPAQREHLGGCGRVIERGCNALGFKRHGPLPRNAPECDGQGLCCFGCPTDAKRSTNVSYVPLALQNHATLFTQARVTRILVENGRAVGVEAEARAGVNGSARVRKLTVRAKAVVLSCGTFGTPTLLLRNGLANSSGELGRNLSLHPACGVLAEFDEKIDGWRGIPQGYGIWDFEDERIVFEGGFTPLDLGAAALPFIGEEFTRTIERYNHLACFGFMVEDTSRGRVRIGATGKPIVTYSLNAQDLQAMQKGMGILAEIYFAAGARRVFPPVDGHDTLRGMRDLERFRRAKLNPLDLSLSAYHPLGTARLGLDPKKSVVGPDHECHDVRGLYVVDGSSVPSSLGANPMITIMMMATRAADILGGRL